MKKRRWIRPAVTLSVLAAVVVAGAVGYWYGSQARQTAASAGSLPQVPKGSPVAKVQVARVASQQMEETLTAYGSVVAALGETRVVSEPFEARVLKVLVRPGQTIASGDPLIDVEPSPNTMLQLDTARDTLDTAQAELKLVQERLKLKLATQTELVQAEQKVQAAQLQLANLQKRGIDGAKTISAKGEGLVSSVSVQEGQIVAAGAPLLATIGQNQIHVQLGIEAEDLANIHPGQAVRLLPVNAPESQAVEGKVHLITREVNPQTRLVDVFVLPPPAARLLLRGFVEGQIVTQSGNVLVVPRSALLPQAGEYLVFTVEHGKAVRHVVKIGMETSQRVQVVGGGLEEGQEVVVQGSAELRDGMPVAVERGP